MSNRYVVRRNRGLPDADFETERAARIAAKKAEGTGLPPELFLPTREDWGLQDSLNGLDWPACKVDHANGGNIHEDFFGLHDAMRAA